jgi:hypothetical protein
MDPIELAAFTRVAPDERGESHGKTAIINLLEAHLTDERVLAFFLKVIGDQAEFDMARITALKILRLWEAPTSELRQRVARHLAAVLPIEADVLVQQWVAIAAEYYSGVPELFAVLAVCLRDSKMDLDVRHNCLAAIERLRGSEQSTAVLRSLVDDEEFGSSVRRTLVTWGSR